MKNLVFNEFTGQDGKGLQAKIEIAPVYREEETPKMSIRFRDDDSNLRRAKSAVRALRDACDDILADMNRVAGVTDGHGVRMLEKQQPLDIRPPTAL